MSSPVQRAQASDAALRRAVLDSAQSWMLQAPAGSGKTELLMQRFLSCLAAVEQPESVLAITFTRKAAGEMRNRIMAALQKARGLSAEQIELLPPHAQQTLRLAQKVLAISDSLGWNLLTHPARLQVRTLDSFCEAVAQRAPLKGLLGGVAQVTDDAQPLYEMAAQRIVDELATPGRFGDAVAKLLQHVDNNVGTARGLLAAMLAQREQWLHFLGRSDAFDPAQQRALRQRLEAALALAVEEELQLVRAHVASALNPEQRAELFALLRYRAEQLPAPAPRVIDSIAASADAVPIEFPAQPLRDICDWPSASAEALTAWRNIVEFLLTSDFNHPALRQKVDKRNGFPSDTKEQKPMRKRCMDLLAEVSAGPRHSELCGALHRVRRLPEPRYSERQWEFMLALMELLPRAAAHLQIVFAEQAAIDFAEYARRALDAIGESSDPTELGLQLGYRIRHVLVDEFQDTNRVQVELLTRLLSTWEADEPCSIFCVGDPMQSIYAFRQADIAIYQQVRREGIAGRKPRFGCLTQNFRSQAKLVEWFNCVFQEIFRDASDLTNAVEYSRAEATRPALDGDAVAITGFHASDRASEAKHLADCIQRELDVPDTEKPSIAVLVRARTHLPELVEALRAANIRYRAVKTDRLAERPVVRDLEALRSALTNLADRTAWLAVLRAPWCGLTLADLLELCRNDERSTICELIRERQPRLSEAGQSALARCLPVLEDALQRCGRISLRALVESAWLRLGGPACLSDHEQGLRDAKAYFALLDEQSQAGRLRDPKHFAAKLRDLFAPSDPSSGIRVEIMPIHQAKGLEWDVVFLPALERRPRKDDKKLLYWRSRRRDEEELLLLGPMEAAGKRKDRKEASIESYLRGLADECSREELKRLFYVAATRACKRLYLSAAPDPEREPASGSMLRLLWENIDLRGRFMPMHPVQATTGEENLVEEQIAAPTVLRRFPPNVQAPPLPSLPPALTWSAQPANSAGAQHRFEWVGELLPRIGVVAHAFLQQIALDGPAHWDDARINVVRAAIATALANAGVAPSEMEQGIRRVSEALRRTLQDERGRWLLSPHAEHRCELAIAAKLDGEVQHVRVDRTFVENGTRWVIDYKITEQQGGDPQRFLEMQVEKYREDLERYARLLRALDLHAGAARPVRCALYFPLQSQWREVQIDSPSQAV